MFKIGDKVKIKVSQHKNMAVHFGATAYVVETACHAWSESPSLEYIRVKWVRDGLDGGQMHGLYLPSKFTKVTKKLKK